MEGKWDLVVHTYMGDMTTHMEFHVDGETLTGMAEDGANGATAPVENGTFKNGGFDYDVTIKTAVGEMTNHLSGKVDGETLVGKSKNPMGEFDVTGTKVG